MSRRRMRQYLGNRTITIWAVLFVLAVGRLIAQSGPTGSIAPRNESTLDMSISPLSLMTGTPSASWLTVAEPIDSPAAPTSSI